MMVLKYLIGGTGGDLDNAPDNFGTGNDLIAVLYQGLSYDYDIFTLGGADLIDLQDANADNSHYVFSGAGRDTIHGGAGREVIRDQSGNDLALLRNGDDDYACGTGNDTVNGGAGRDELIFNYLYNNAGVPTFNTSGVTCDLAKTGVQNFGVFGRDRVSGFEDVLGGDGADRLFGTNGANQMSGYDGNNLMDGRGGTDNLYDGGGNSTLIGGGGADTLTGASGRDRLTGGLGADEINLTDPAAARDLVIYTRMNDSGTGLSPASIDTILNFDAGGAATDDRIDLRAIDSNPNTAGNQAFLFRGTGNFTSPKGEVRLVQGGGNTLVQIDIDGDGASEMNFLVQGVTGLTAGDFFL
jgi:Ca2+-binding RTX toxin-like protein